MLKPSGAMFGKPVHAIRREIVILPLFAVRNDRRLPNWLGGYGGWHKLRHTYLLVDPRHAHRDESLADRPGR
jgi:hypothetical protein